MPQTHHENYNANKYKINKNNVNKFCKQQAGLTLLELLVTLALISIGLAFSIPSYEHGVRQAQARSAVHQIYSSINTARQQAVSRNRLITLCGSDDGRTCSTIWRQKILVFEDSNMNRERDDDEPLFLDRSLTINGQLHMKVSRGVPFIRFKPDGQAAEFGQLIYCPEHEDPIHIRAVIISRVGRPRHPRDPERDGIPNDHRGNIEC